MSHSCCICNLDSHSVVHTTHELNLANCSNAYNRYRMSSMTEENTVSISVSDSSSHEVQGSGKNFDLDF